ncbi:hypothetical protein [Methanimicrococcus hacksteinii]|uniref:hypothetical protein n=1 Tax=Methanimicrococcus hacksteinii TaxID=3028293 RepID=UPI00298EE3AE|nr:hypothetical protein [Methanimicrococcus sp. At1]
MGYVFYFELQTVDTAENGRESSLGNGQKLQNKNVSVEKGVISAPSKRFQIKNIRIGYVQTETS